jgi:hypothetical protein
MLSAKQAAEHRRQLRRDIAKSLKEKDRAKVRALRAELHEAIVKRDAALAAAREKCRADRLTVRERVEKLREDARAKLREVVQLEREQARGNCNARKTKARSSTLPAIERARLELNAEREYLEELARIEASQRKRRAEMPRTSSRAERKNESDDEVRANISPELVPLFDKVRRHIKASARETRTEAFLRYAEEHPDEVLDVMEDAADRLVREMQERQAKDDRAAARRPAKTSTRKREYTAEELAAVPF